MAGGIVQTLGSAFMGDVDYTPTSQKLEQAKSDEERRLGLQSRGQQEALGLALQKQMRGEGPSVAREQMMRGREQMMRASTAAAASGRGSNAALANQQGATAGQNVAMQTNRDAAMLRGQEAAAATSQYANLLQAQRMQDLQARGMSVDEAKAQLDYYAKLQQTKAGIAMQEQKGSLMGVGAIGSLVGGISDIRAKTEVRPLTPTPRMASEYGNMDQRLAMPDNAQRQPEKNDRAPINYGAWGTEQGTMQGMHSLGKSIKGVFGGDSSDTEFDEEAYNQRQMENEVSDIGAKKLMPMPEPEQIRPTPARTSVIEQRPVAVEQPAYAAGALSDEASKEQIRALSNENAALRAALKPGKESEVASKGGVAGSRAAATRELKAELASVREARKSVPPAFEQMSKEQAQEMYDNPSGVKFIRDPDTYAPPVPVEPTPAGVTRRTPAMKARDEIEDAMYDRSAQPKYQPGIPTLSFRSSGRPSIRSGNIRVPLPWPSDERTKEYSALKSSIEGQSASKHPVSENLAKLTPISFKYDNNETGNWKDVYGDQTRVGMSANQMEKNPVTNALVEKDDRGLRRVDPAQASMTAMAGTVDLSKRVKELEAAIAKMKGKPASDVKAKKDVTPLASDVDEAYPASKPAALGSSLKKKASVASPIDSETQAVAYEEGARPLETSPRIERKVLGKAVAPAVPDEPRREYVQSRRLPLEPAVGKAIFGEKGYARRMAGDVNEDRYLAEAGPKMDVMATRQLVENTGSPGAMKSHIANLERLLRQPGFDPGSPEGKQITQELRSTKAAYDEGQFHALGKKLAAVSATPKGGFQGATARERGAARARFLEGATNYAQSAYERQLKAEGVELIPRVRTVEIDAPELKRQFNQRGIKVSDAEIKAILAKRKRDAESARRGEVSL